MADSKNVNASGKNEMTVPRILRKSFHTMASSKAAVSPFTKVVVNAVRRL
jgi:hypothetical protein